ncbi:hypothetical protein PT277_05115 [Acetobacteraceae bacterium ESL0709]|nr:hypothetical protein [Acetobacteraceae bacterium ESL0697]MDF7678075.1 hypothetical protein [Acetobacteraceae bacterium ESL0709]
MTQSGTSFDVYEVERWKREAPVYEEVCPEMLDRLYDHYIMLEKLQDMSMEKETLERKELLLLMVSLREISNILWFIDKANME